MHGATIKIYYAYIVYVSYILEGVYLMGILSFSECRCRDVRIVILFLVSIHFSFTMASLDTADT
jgi:hypothetical protein